MLMPWAGWKLRRGEGGHGVRRRGKGGVFVGKEVLKAGSRGDEVSWSRVGIVDERNQVTMEKEKCLPFIR